MKFWFLAFLMVFSFYVNSAVANSNYEKPVSKVGAEITDQLDYPLPETLEQSKTNHKMFLKDQKNYESTIPAVVRESLKAKNKSFQPMFFGSADNSGSRVTSGDFNCDGEKDYAIVGVERRELPNGIMKTSNSTKKIQEFSKYLNMMNYDRAATVFIGLSNRGQFEWKKEKGSYTMNSGEDCSCCEITEDIQKEMKRKRCDFLYIGCCQKDGSYNFWGKIFNKAVGGGGC